MSLERTCLYCLNLATPPVEHIISAQLGGILCPVILCVRHNGGVGNLCDAPLVEQLRPFVNFLRAKIRDKRGATIRAFDKNGMEYEIGADHVARVKRTILDRDESGKPTRVVFSSPEEGVRWFARAKRSSEVIGYEEHAKDSPMLNISNTRDAGPVVLGGDSGFRGVLKIAYEFARGELDAAVTDASLERGVHAAILAGNDPASFVRWLPYERVPGTPRADHGHRLITWQSGIDALVVVELFACLPFVVRLPGVCVREPIEFSQGVRGEGCAFTKFAAFPEWEWADVPEHAQPMMFGEQQRRLNEILGQMQVADRAEILTDAVLVAFTELPESATDRDVVNRLIPVLERLMVPTSEGDLAGLERVVADLRSIDRA